MVSHFSLALLGACGDNREQPLRGCAGPRTPSVPSTRIPVGCSCRSWSCILPQLLCAAEAGGDLAAARRVGIAALFTASAVSPALTVWISLPTRATNS